MRYFIVSWLHKYKYGCYTEKNTIPWNPSTLKSRSFLTRRWLEKRAAAGGPFPLQKRAVVLSGSLSKISSRTSKPQHCIKKDGKKPATHYGHWTYSRFGHHPGNEPRVRWRIGSIGCHLFYPSGKLERFRSCVAEGSQYPATASPSAPWLWGPPTYATIG